MKNNNKLFSFSEIKASGKLPSPGGVVLEILRLAAEPDTSIADLAQAIQVDPALTGRLLAYANSGSLYRGKAAASAADAVTRVGLAALRDIALGFSLVAANRGGQCAAFDYNHFWAKSLATGVAARTVAARSMAGVANDLFTCGLLSGVGRLALATVFAEEYGVILRAAGGRGGEALAIVERAELGIDHRQLATLMMADWGVSETLVQALNMAFDANSSNGEVEPRVKKMVDMLRLGVQIADRIIPDSCGGKSLGDAQLLSGMAQEEANELINLAKDEWQALCTTFGIDTKSFDIPALADGQAAEHCAEGSSGQADGMERIEVLLVGGKGVARSILSEACMVAGCNFAGVVSPQDMLREIVSHTPHIVVVDAVVDDPEGLNACKTLRESEFCKEVYLFAIANDSREGNLRAFAAGVDDCLKRPLDVEEITARLRVACRVAKLQQEVDVERRETRKYIAELSLANQKLEQSVITDPLTGVANRVLFQDRLQQLIARGSREKERVAVMFLDLDHFKSVNDSLGHSVGDALLKEFSERVKGAIRDVDTLARMGGDEFALIAPGVRAAEDAALVCARIHSVLAAPFKLAGRDVSMTASVGISVFPDHADDSEALTRYADAAMYAAKKSGRGRTVIYTREVGEKMERREQVQSALRDAIRDGGLWLAYQPQFELASGKMVGVEALVRLTTKALGEIPTPEFIEVAEETGLILPLGEWVLRQAALQAVEWSEGLFPEMKMSVNLSAKQLARQDLSASIKKVLKDTGIPAHLMGIEVTETVLMENIDKASLTLQQLAEVGIEISLDDFGTGYSSLAYLAHLPISNIKLDRSFVAKIPDDPQVSALVSSMIDMARSMKLRVVAEGVETMRQLEFLRKVACGVAQGYLFSKPLTAEALEERFGGERQSARAPMVTRVA